VQRGDHGRPGAAIDQVLAELVEPRLVLSSSSGWAASAPSIIDNL